LGEAVLDAFVGCDGDEVIANCADEWRAVRDRTLFARRDVG